MKAHIYRTPYQFLEQPIVIGTCEDFTPSEVVPTCACPESVDFPKKISKHIATLRFGKFVFEPETCKPCGSVSVPIKK